MAHLSVLVDKALESVDMDPIDLTRAVFITLASVILPGILLDSLYRRFIVYGARATPTDSKSRPSAESPSNSLVTRTLDSLASLKVPHSYFTHFYVASTLLSVFWASQLMLDGPAFRAIALRIHPEHLEQSMSFHQVMVCWTLMFIQGTRRLVECLSFSKPSSSSMWFAHWAVGLVFYMTMSVAIWIEGTGALLTHEITLDDIKVTNPPSLRTFLCLPVFLMASGLQHDCHHYLFSLEKYTLPIHPLFRMVVCPHYTAESVIYLSLALIAAPPGQTINKTLLLAVLFIVVNLGITAATTKRWYTQKFGEESMQGRYRMIPFVY